MPRMDLAHDRAAMRPRLGTWGAWIGALTAVPASLGRPTAQRVEAAGFPTLWYPEGMGVRESFSNAAVLLGATDEILIASGIANVWARDALASARALARLVGVGRDHDLVLDGEDRVGPHHLAGAPGVLDRHEVRVRAER